MAPRETLKEQMSQAPSESQESFAAPAASGTNQKKRKQGNILGKILNAVLIVAVLGLGYAYYTKQAELRMLKDPAAQAEVARKEAEAVASQASQIVLLPEGEEVPEVLTINDADLAIKEQPNLAGVVTGDKILLYVSSGKAIVYSPSRNKIVNILPVVLQRPQGQAATSGTGTQNTTTGSGSQATTSNQ